MTDGTLVIVAITVVVTLASMILHEVMHGLVAYWLGDDTAKRSGRLTLNPLSHIDPFLTVLVPALLALSHLPVFGAAKPVPYNPSRVKFGDAGAALVAIAGPLTNLVLAFICFGLSVLFQHSVPLYTFFWTATTVNLGFFAFNILPIPPLDGSRVLYAFAPDFVRQIMEAIERYGLMILFALVLLGSSFFGTIIVTITTFILRIFGAVFGVTVLY